MGAGGAGGSAGIRPGGQMIKKMVATVVAVAALVLVFAPSAPASECGIPQAYPGCAEGQALRDSGTAGVSNSTSS